MSVSFEVARDIQRQCQMDIDNCKGDVAKINKIKNEAFDAFSDLYGGSSTLKEREQIRQIAANVLTYSPGSQSKSKSETFFSKKVATPTVAKTTVSSRRGKNKKIQVIDLSSKKKVEVDYDAFRIAGDGNCCFRSISHSLVRSVHKNPMILTTLKKRRKVLTDSGNTQVAKDLSQVFKLLKKCEGSKILSKNDDEELTVLLRQLSCDWNEQVDFTVGLELDGESRKEYLERKREDRQWGGELELKAMALAMGIRIQVISVKDGSLMTYGEEGSPLAITVEFNNHHYSDVKINKIR